MLFTLTLHICKQFVERFGNIVLVIDEVHTIVGAGDAEGGMNAANILKPALSRGEIQVIGATTLAEYRKYIEKDAALERRFQPILVDEPSIESTVNILLGIKKYYEGFHGINIPDSVIRRAVVLSERYITDRYLPDKAIDLLDEACSYQALNTDCIGALCEWEEKAKTTAILQEELENSTPSDAEMEEHYRKLADLKQQSLVEQERRLDAMMDKAQTLGEMLAIEDKLTDVRAQINALNKQIQLMDKSVDYSYVYVELSEVIEYHVEDPTYLQRLGASFGDSFVNFAEVLGEVLIIFVWILPFLLVGGVIAIVAVTISQKKKRTKKNDSEKEEK